MAGVPQCSHGHSHVKLVPVSVTVGVELSLHKLVVGAMCVEVLFAVQHSACTGQAGVVQV